MLVENQNSVVEASVEVITTDSILKEELSIVALEERLEMATATPSDVIIDIC